MFVSGFLKSGLIQTQASVSFTESAYICDTKCRFCAGSFSRDWVVSVEGGEEVAEAVAGAGGLQLLGEVLPGSGLWHLRYSC